MTYPTTGNDRDEMFRQYVAEQMEKQTRALNRIADNTAVVKVLAIILIVLIVLWVLFSIVAGISAANSTF